MAKQFIKTMLDVETILSDFKGSRDSDKALILEFLLSKTSLKSLSDSTKQKIAKAVYCELPAFETITRCRRKLQSDGYYKGSMNTQQLRRSKAKAMKAMFR